MPAEFNSNHVLVLGIVLPVAYLLFMFANPARGSLRDGLRCVLRYPRLWSVFAGLGLCYVLFQLACRAFLFYLLPEGSPERPHFIYQQPWFFSPDDLQIALHHAVLPALETVAGLFNCLVTTFPLSALAALLFLVNWGGHHAVLRRALIRRFRRWGVALYATAIICALAAVVKPAIYFALTSPALHGLSPYLLLETSLFIDWLSFLFETALGVYVQIYLILLAYVWVRGLNFEHSHLRDFAVRRFSAAMKWTAILLLMATLVIHLPLILSSLGFAGEIITTAQVLEFIRTMARPALVLVLFVFCSMQLLLVFHGETLREAFQHHLSFLRRQAWPLLWFFAAALLHAWVLQVANQILLAGLGEGTLAGVIWQLIFPLFAALLAAWLLSAWVCLFQRWQHGRSELEPLVRF